MDAEEATPPPALIIFLALLAFAPSNHQLAAEEISLSQMTLSHQMIRLLFCEQIYRAMTILRGEPYHHE